MTSPADALAAVEALIEHAKKISPSPYMSVYVSDLERALGRDAEIAHKVGAPDLSAGAS